LAFLALKANQQSKTKQKTWHFLKKIQVSGHFKKKLRENVI